MPVYEWQRSKPLRVDRNTLVQEGDTFRAPEEVGDAFGDLLEETDDGQDVDAEVSFGRAADEAGDAVDGAEADETAAGEDTEDVDVDQAVQDLLDGNVAEVREGIESGDYDDRLGQIEAAADRKTVQDAVDDRREELAE